VSVGDRKWSAEAASTLPQALALLLSAGFVVSLAGWGWYRRHLLQSLQDLGSSCYVNLQGKKKTLPLSDSSHRLLNYLLRLYFCLRRLSQRSGAFRLNDLLFEVAAVATRSSCLFVRDQETTCASHFQPCWQCYRHMEGHEVAVVTLFMLCEKTWLCRERLHKPFPLLPPLARGGS